MNVLVRRTRNLTNFTKHAPSLHSSNIHVHLFFWLVELLAFDR